MAKKRPKRKLDVKSKKKNRKKSKSRSKRRYDSKKLQNRLQRSQERAGGGMKSVVKGENVTLYRPGDGAHIIDIIPYEAGSNDPLVEGGDPTYTLEIWVHPQLGPDKQTRICMERMFNKPCAVCDHRQQLRDKGKDEEVWKKLFPKCRHLYNVVSYDKGEEKKGVQVFDVSYHYSEKHIIPLSKRATRGGKERTVNFADPVDGKSINFTIEPAKSKNDYPSYVGWAFEDRDYEIEDDILDAAHCLDEIIHIPTAKEVEKLYWGESGSSKKRGRDDDDDDDDDDETLDDLLEEVDDMDDMDDLEDFIGEHDLDVKIKRKDDEEDVKEKIVEALEEQHGDSDDEGDDDDEPAYTKKQIRKMKKKKLLRVIKEEDLDVDPDDAEDTEELQDMIIEELYDDE